VTYEGLIEMGVVGRLCSRPGGHRRGATHVQCSGAWFQVASVCALLEIKRVPSSPQFQGVFFVLME
jgi:hypothetical protein